MARFIAVYEGPTVSSARLLALTADPRIVSKFFEELVGETPADDEGERETARVLELAHGKRGE